MRKEVLAFVSDQGGIGKTTFIHNLAVELSREFSVLIVDLEDKDISSGSLYTSKSFYEVICEGEVPRDCIQSRRKNIDILHSYKYISLHFSKMVYGNPEKYPDPYFVLRDMLKDLVSGYDYVLLNTSSSSDLLGLNALNMATKFFICLKPSIDTINSYLSSQAILTSQFKSNDLPYDLSGVIFMLVDNQNEFHKDVFEQVRRLCFKHRTYLFGTTVPVISTFDNNDIKRSSLCEHPAPEYIKSFVMEANEMHHLF